MPVSKKVKATLAGEPLVQAKVVKGVEQNKRFSKGSGCYTCSSCRKKTRDVNKEEGQAGLCAKCYEKAGDENSVSDGMMTQAEFDAKWGASKQAPSAEQKTTPKVRKVSKQLESLDAHKTSCPACVALVKLGHDPSQKYHQDVHVDGMMPDADEISKLVVTGMPPYLSAGAIRSTRSKPTSQMTGKELMSVEERAKSDPSIARDLLFVEKRRALINGQDVSKVTVEGAIAPKTNGKVEKAPKAEKAPKPEVVETPVENKAGAQVTRTEAGQYKVWGISVSAILRWLGKNGWTKETVHPVLEALNVVDGRSYNMGHVEGKYGDPPTLTQEQGSILKALLPKPAKTTKKGAKK